MSKYIVHNFLRVATDFVPETFGRLTALGPKFLLPISGKTRSCQVCRCDCGSVEVYSKEAITSKKRTRCRACAIKQSAKSRWVHGEANKTKEFTAWWNMNRRCYDSKATGYENYGGRGIEVCARWREPKGQGYLNFLSDMGRCPPGCNSVERKLVSEGYYPENCKWATQKEQARNKRNTVHVTAFNRTQCLADWAAEYGIAANTLKRRLQSGRSVEEALTAPIGKLTRQRKPEASPEDANNDHCT